MNTINTQITRDNSNNSNNSNNIVSITNIKSIYYIFFSITIVIWLSISTLYIYNLRRSNDVADQRFLYILLVIIIYPLYVYIMTCVDIYKTSNIVGPWSRISCLCSWI